jgi:pimeloyl-ACP methyl ester carboxylesterase
VSVPHPRAFRTAISGDQDQKSKSQYMRFFQEEGTPDVLLADGAAALRLMYAELPADAVDEYLRVLTDRAALAGALNYYRTMDGTLATGIGPITIPSMLVWGDQDVAVGRTGVEGTGAQVEGPFQLEIIEGAGHWIPELAADTLNRLLIDHIEKAAAGS